MKRFFLIIVCCLSCLLLHARGDLRLPDTRTMGLAGSGVTQSPLFNPALSALMTKASCRMDYFNRYSVKELSTVSASLVIPNRRLPFAVHLLSFGYDEYRETLVRLSAAKRLNKQWALGVAADYTLAQSILFEEHRSSLAADLGVSYQPVENLLIAASMINYPTVNLRVDSLSHSQMAPFSLLLGFHYDLINDLFITGSIEYERSAPIAYSMGMEYCAYPDFWLRCGLQSSPMRPVMGASFRLAAIMMDLVVRYVPPLGVSFGLGLSYSF